MLHETISVNATLKTRTAILQVYFVRFQNVAAKKKKLLLNSFGLPYMLHDLDFNVTMLP